MVKWDEAGLQKDLAFQAHTLAQALSDKFATIKNAIGVVIWVLLPALALVALIELLVVGAGVLDKAGK